MKEDVVKEIKKVFSKRIIDFQEGSKKRIYLTVDKKDLLKVIEYLFNNLEARFITETGLDTRAGIEILYHFSFDELDKIVTIRTLLDREKPEVESVVSIIKGAEWIEREIHDILGVRFKNHPNLKRFILAEDWPKGKYPYRKVK